MNSIINVLRETNRDFQIDNAKGLLSDIECLHLAVERISSHQLSMRFKLDKHKALNRLRLWKQEQERHIKWLEDLPAIASEVSNDSMNSAWSRDVGEWRAKEMNCD